MQKKGPRSPAKPLGNELHLFLGRMIEMFHSLLLLDVIFVAKKINFVFRNK